MTRWRTFRAYADWYVRSIFGSWLFALLLVGSALILLLG